MQNIEGKTQRFDVKLGASRIALKLGTGCYFGLNETMYENYEIDSDTLDQM